MSIESQKSLSRDEGKSPHAEDWLATSSEVQELAAATPEVAPHSCPHCREWELDFLHNTFNHIPQKGHGHTQSSLTGAYAREKAELGCLFFERLLRTVIQSHPERPMSKSELDGAVVSVSSRALNSDKLFSIYWKNGKTEAYNETYELYMPHGMPLHPPYIVNQDADRARYSSPDWHPSRPCSAQFSTQFEPKLSEGQQLDRRLQLNPRQVFITA